MTFEATVDTSGAFLTFKTSGMLTRAHYQATLDDTAALLRANEGLPLLCDWCELEGWADDSRDAYGYHSWLDYAELLRRRIAILCPEQHLEHAYWFMDFAQARNIEAETFAPQEREKAMTWLLAEA